MQAHIVKQAPSLGGGYIDPFWISSSIFNEPKRWKLDGEELAAGKTVEEKEAIRKEAIRKKAYMVAARISKALLNLQHNDMIWIPYHFG